MHPKLGRREYDLLLAGDDKLKFHRPFAKSCYFVFGTVIVPIKRLKLQLVMLHPIHNKCQGLNLFYLSLNLN
jgi:hypothetical protein